MQIFGSSERSEKIPRFASPDFELVGGPWPKVPSDPVSGLLPSYTHPLRSNPSTTMKSQSKNQSTNTANEADDNLMAMKKLQLRRVLRELDEVRGVGTSLITLMVPPTGSLQRTLTKLHDELALSDQIQSRV